MASQPPSVDLYDGEEDQPTQARPSDAPTRHVPLPDQLREIQRRIQEDAWRKKEQEHG